jgi:hypothetical protein
MTVSLLNDSPVRDGKPKANPALSYAHACQEEYDEKQIEYLEASVELAF